MFLVQNCCVTANVFKDCHIVTVKDSIITSFHEAIHLLSKQEHYMFASVKARNSSFFPHFGFPNFSGLAPKNIIVANVDVSNLTDFSTCGEALGQSILDCMEKFVSVQLA